MPEIATEPTLRQMDRVVTTVRRQQLGHRMLGWLDFGERAAFWSTVDAMENMCAALYAAGLARTCLRIDGRNDERIDRMQSYLDEARLRGDASGNYSQLCLLYTSPSPRDRQKSRMPSSA